MNTVIPIPVLSEDDDRYRQLSPEAAIAALPALLDESERISETAERLAVWARIHQAKVSACLEALQRANLLAKARECGSA